jgi:acylphosphatase
VIVSGQRQPRNFGRSGQFCNRPRRLEAEFVRDNALYVSGLLNLDMGGPSVRPPQPAGMSTRFLVSGLVQGVGFRWFVARHARSLGLTGFARNLADGRVEVVVHGPDETLTKLERLLQQGPANAQVDRVERWSDAEPVSLGRSFDIR